MPNKNSKIEIRIEAEDKEIIQNYAKKLNLTVSELIRKYYLQNIIEEEKRQCQEEQS